MKKSILLIDDEYVTRLIHEMLIKREDPHAVIYFAENGSEGLKFMEESREGVRDFPSVILLDLNMPKVNGFEFMENYNSNFNRPEINIYMVTSSIDPEDHKKAFSYGVTDIKPKPLSTTDVRLMLASS